LEYGILPSGVLATFLDGGILYCDLARPLPPLCTLREVFGDTVGKAPRLPLMVLISELYADSLPFAL
jgi:hypothetical protein